MNSRIIAAIVMVLSLFSLQADQTIDPNKKIVFLWDLHHVVLKPHQQFRAALKYPNKAKALTHKQTRGKVLKLLLKGIFKEQSSAKFVHIAEKYKNPHLKELILLASNAQKPMQDTIAIIKELKEKGFTHHVGSNIGSSSFIALNDPEMFPEISEIFKYFDIPQSHVVVHRKGGVVKKPDPEFFREYIAKNNIDFSTTQIIFIDDKKENIQTAQELGFIGIQFKNAAQLRKDLATLGIDIS